MSVYWKLFGRAALFSLFLFAVGCHKGALPGAPLDQATARVVADGVVADVIGERHAELFGRMEALFQAKTSPSALPSALQSIAAYGGKPLEADFKAVDEGFKVYEDGSRKRLLKFWYAVRTTKSEKGTYFLFVEVVPDGQRLACTTFSMVSFFNGVPEQLK